MGNLAKNLQWLFIVTLISLPFAGCNIDRSGLKPSTGKTNELLVITNSEALWKGRVGQEISEFFGQYQAGLPQPEKTYDIAHIPEPSFSQMFKTHHNIFILDIDPSFDQPVIETHLDFWAKPQRVVKMTVGDEQAFYSQFELYKASFMELFNANERRRASQAFGTIEDIKIKNHLISKYDINIMIPKSFYIANEADEFVWLRREAQQFSQGILIYFYAYTDTIAFDPDRIISIRDGFTSKFVPGPSDGSFMKIAMIEPPVSRRIDFNGFFAVEMRGLWELEGDFMGGPFISYTVVDPRYNRVVTIDGFVYNPNHDKKNLLRQLEALLHTLDFPDESVTENVKQ